MAKAAETRARPRHDVAALRPDGTPAALANAKVVLEREIWDYYLRYYYSHLGAHWTPSYEVVDEREVSLTRQGDRVV